MHVRRTWTARRDARKMNNHHDNNIYKKKKTNKTNKKNNKSDLYDYDEHKKNIIP